jgi:hypothetical protein
MADGNRRDENEPNTTYSGEFGARNRNTPGRTPRELGLDPDEMKGHDLINNAPEASGDDMSLARKPDQGGIRSNPPETPGVEKMGEGGISMSGGRAGGTSEGRPLENDEDDRG